MAVVNTIDDDFANHIDAMESVSTAASQATNLTGQRKWMYPPLNGWSGDPLDILGMDQAFNRDNLNSQYRSVIGMMNQAGKIGESMAVKLQVDYIAALERGFRTRHCSSVRAKIHSSARRKGLGESTGPLNNGVVVYLNRLLEAAHDSPTPVV